MKEPGILSLILGLAQCLTTITAALVLATWAYHTLGVAPALALGWLLLRNAKAQRSVR